jgi:hypothetical protein
MRCNGMVANRHRDPPISSSCQMAKAVTVYGTTGLALLISAPFCRLEAASPERGARQACAAQLSGGTHFLIINNSCSSISTISFQ